MKYLTLSYITLLFFASTLLCNDSKSSDSSDGSSDGSSSEPLAVGQGPGKVANTDTTKYAGVYQFTYFYPEASKDNKTLLLPCKNSTTFSLDFPAGEGVDIGKDFSSFKDGADPIYKTVQSSWVIKELAIGKGGFDTLKVSVYVDDSEEKLVCWTVNFVNKKLIINLNPDKVTACPTKFIPSTKTCRKELAYLLGTCVSGPCTGDGSKPREENSVKSATSNASIAKASLSSLAILLFITFITV